jgi:hypothetical protein
VQHDTIRTLSPLRADIKNRAPRAMRLLYCIGKWFLNADVTMSIPTSRKPTNSYQTGAFPAFQPQTFPLHQSELDGLYTSTVQSVQTYFDFFDQLHQIKEVGPETTQFVVLAMLLDFMAFAPVLRTRMDAGGVATRSYCSPNGDQHIRCSGPVPSPQGKMGSNAMRYRRQQRTPHNLQ